MHPIVYLMIATFGATVMVLFLGIATMGRNRDEKHAAKSSKLMMLRIALSFFLLAQILYYVLVIKGA